MDIGIPKRKYTIEPIWSPVPKAKPAPAPERTTPPVGPPEPARRP